MNRSEFEAQIIAKASADPAYRARLLADPKAVISEELNTIKAGTALPPDITVTVLQETPRQLYLVLPVQPDTVGEVAVSPTETGVTPQGVGPVAATSAVVVVDVFSQSIYTSVQASQVVMVVVD